MYGGLYQKEKLSELYFVAYYDRALIHNTPYYAPHFGWDEVVAIATSQIAKNPGVFQKVFLFNAKLSNQSIILLWQP